MKTFTYQGHHFYLRGERAWDVYGYLQTLEGTWEWVLMTRERATDSAIRFIFQWLGIGTEQEFHCDYMFRRSYKAEVWWEFKFHLGRFRAWPRDRIAEPAIRGLSPKRLRCDEGDV